MFFLPLCVLSLSVLFSSLSLSLSLLILSPLPHHECTPPTPTPECDFQSKPQLDALSLFLPLMAQLNAPQQAT